MRRITLWLLSTVAALVLLFGYRTSTMGAGGGAGTFAAGTGSGGGITEVTAVQVPDGNVRDQQINGYAVPILRQQALAAQSARIDTVSGATVTSDGYRESLQAAIDAAHLG
ncbi:FMN-binding protein [Micromonospora sp. NPDC048830]|uniref:FMN-binding protein n=1 Tax=Micromonospora sp. NPDC048830 TaxID=3364257 RepID=UPI003724B475